MSERHVCSEGQKMRADETRWDTSSLRDQTEEKPFESKKALNLPSESAKPNPGLGNRRKMTGWKRKEFPPASKQKKTKLLPSSGASSRPQLAVGLSPTEFPKAAAGGLYRTWSDAGPESLTSIKSPLEHEGSCKRL